MSLISQLMSSNHLFFPANSPKPKDVQCTTMWNREKQQIVTFQRLSSKLMQNLNVFLRHFVSVLPSCAVNCICTYTLQYHTSRYLHVSLNLIYRPLRSSGGIFGDRLRWAAQLFLLFWQLRKQNKWTAQRTQRQTNLPAIRPFTHCSATPSHTHTLWRLTAHTHETGGNTFRSTEKLECRNRIPLISDAL